MAMHLNSYGLKQKGFELIAAYNCFDKWYFMEDKKKWRYTCTTVECWKSEKTYLVRLKKGYIWDLAYDTKEAANAKVKSLFENSTFHKKVF